MTLYPSTTTTATDTIPVSISPYNYTTYPAGRININDWVYIEDLGLSFSTTTKVLGLSTTTAPYWIKISGQVTLSAAAEIRKKLSNVWVFAEGTTFNATSSAADNFGFGVFGLVNMAAGTYNLTALKAPADNTDFCDVGLSGVSAPGSIKIFVTAGCQPGGGGMSEKFEVNWTAPGPKW